jgi:hypothetical protein
MLSKINDTNYWYAGRNQRLITLIQMTMLLSSSSKNLLQNVISSIFLYFNTQRSYRIDWK